MGWIRNIVITVVLAAVGLAIWKMYGGDLGSFFDMIWNVFYTVVDAASNVLVTAWQSVFGE